MGLPVRRGGGERASGSDYLAHLTKRLRSLLLPYWLAIAMFHASGTYKKMAYLASLNKGPWWAVLPYQTQIQRWFFAFLKVFGYAPLFGASWFITLAVLLTPIPPILANMPSFCTQKKTTVGMLNSRLLSTHPGLCSVLGLTTTALAARNINFGHSFMRRIGFNRSAFDVYLFPFLYFGPLVTGCCFGLADCSEKMPGGELEGRSVLPLMSILYATGVSLHTIRAGPFDSFEDPPTMQALLRALDVPLSVLLLFSARAMTAMLGQDSTVVSAISMIGKRSWNIYLGHIVILNVFFGKQLMKMKPIFLWCVYICGGLCFDQLYTRLLRNAPVWVKGKEDADKLSKQKEEQEEHVLTN